MMLVDKGYYDYDFERVKANTQLLYEDTVKSDSEVRGLLSRFGIGKPKEQSIEELQEYVMSENSKTQENGR
jgi:hypothetical protein